MIRCTQCGKDLESEDKWVINWGWCDGCWEDNIDADHLMILLDHECDFKPITQPPGPPSEKVQRLLKIINRRLGREESPKA